jgi:hypothetical protein
MSEIRRPVPEPEMHRAGFFNLEEIASAGGKEAEDAKKLLELRKEAAKPKVVKHQVQEMNLEEIKQAEQAASAQAKAQAEHSIKTQIVERPKKISAEPKKPLNIWQKMFGGR